MTYERQFFTYLENLKRRIDARPLNLGGVSSSGGGVGGPPGGYLGYLPQTRITYDKLEAEASGTNISGSLLDNLNHIRYRIAQLETGSGSGGSSDFLGLTDTPSAYSGHTGETLVVNASEDGLEFQALGSGSDTYKAMVSSDDTTPDYLGNKLVAGTDIEITVLNSGADESLQITSTASGSGGGNSGFNYIQEDITNQIPATNDDFTLNYTPSSGTLVLHYNGLTQQYDNFTILNSGVHTKFSPVSGDELIAEYFYDTTGVGITDPTISVYSGNTLLNNSVNALKFLGMGVSDSGGGMVTVSGGTGGASTFLNLTDTPSSYIGNAGKSAVVNDAETALEFVTVSGSSTGGGNTIFHPDVPPTSSSAYDDEFDDDSFDTGLWSEFDPGSLLTVSEDAAGLKLSMTANAGIDYAGVAQSVQSGSYTYVAKIYISPEMRNMYSHMGLVLFEGLTSTSDFKGIFFNPTRQTSYQQRVQVIHMSDYQNISSESADYEQLGYTHTHMYLRIRHDGTNYYYEWSTDGIGWRFLEKATSSPFTPAYVGVVIQSEDGTYSLNGRVKFFRYINSDVGSDGYISGGELGAGGSSGEVTADFSYWNPDAPPASPSSYDDEFDDSSFDSNLWSTYDEPTGLTKTENEWGLELQGSTSLVLQGIYQVAPSGDGWTIYTKVSWIGKQANDNKAGLLLLEDTSNLSTSDAYCHYAYAGSAGAGIQSEHMNSYNSFNTNDDNFVSDKWGATYWLRIHATSTQFILGWSLDGLGWRDRKTITRDFTPDGFGLVIRRNSNVEKVVFHYFRYFADDTVDHVLEGDRIDGFRT